MRKFTFVAGLALSMLAFAGGPALGQTTIDNFSLPAQPAGGTDYVTISGGLGASGSLVQSGVDAIGGTRVYYAQKTNSDPASFQVGLNSTQEFRQVANPVTAGRSKLLYGYSAVNNASLDANNYTAGHTFSNLNLNVTGTTGVRLNYGLGGNASTGTITVTLISGTGISQQVSNVTLPIVSAGNALLTFPTASFVVNNPAINFGDIDQIVVSMDGVPQGTNASMDNIQFAAVPEPGSIALLGLTAIGCTTGMYFRKLRRSKRRGGVIC